MSSKRLLQAKIGSLTLRSPAIIASGVWPMEPERWPSGVVDNVGAICTKGLTLSPKEGNRGIRIWETNCGLLNSIGLQNPGLEAFLKNEFDQLKDCGCPIIFNLAFHREEELYHLLDILTSFGFTGTVEINVSCPNVSGGGMTWALNLASLEKVLKRARALWRGDMWVKLSPNVPKICDGAIVAESCGADAVVVANTWLGLAIDVKRKKPVFERIFAGLSGPAILPLSLRLVWEAASAVKIPVIGCGGVADAEGALAMLMAGASAFQVGTALFSDFEVVKKICDGIENYMAENQINDLEEIVGIAQKA
ncbi:dihydroorotate dehydrogenase family protein [Thermovirga lienii DSM 17291]|uniref:Dihydroorotate dehydrogenase n=1 Tax=Thermovirga lienii (strain ATCC BAA-1197 / DSM 17291 / Cas60314) TaxID=580340 RepID=G7VAC6_THELD|nr:dihydroorotate dehydrogenase [Thermovirga lienii]AER66826.1 dihydroorotate dehydrogenase family protein [Thermovirga lienii DSM 17291]